MDNPPLIVNGLPLDRVIEYLVRKHGIAAVAQAVADAVAQAVADANNNAIRTGEPALTPSGAPRVDPPR